MASLDDTVAQVGSQLGLKSVPDKKLAPNILWRLGGDTLFAVLGGLLGAWYATRMAARPMLEARVEKA